MMVLPVLTAVPADRERRPRLMVCMLIVAL